MNQVSRNDISISKLQLTEENGLYTVTAMVDGEALWFQSSDHPLRIAPEGFAGVLLVPAMHLGKNLVFEDPLCPVWLDNAHQLMDIYHEWWGWPPIEIHSPQHKTPVHYEGDKTGLCFSGGVDSFHSITTYPAPIDFIITVHGYDIALSDEDGAAHAIRNIREVAKEYPVTPLAIKTNMRQHHIAHKRYRNSFEGALAAIGYLVEGMNTLIISSDYSREALRKLEAKRKFAFGSHWKTGPLRSSAEINIIHFGEQYTRDEKLRQIANNPLLRKHLRVCQRNLKPDFDLAGQHLNCGVCDKCLRTLIALMQTTSLDDFECFANTDHLAQHINQVEFVGNYASTTYEKFCTIGVEPPIEQAIHALVWRSRFLNKRPWLGRKGRKLLVKLFVSWVNLKHRLLSE